jgi:D-3-phosphoglycerate dehydrogenase
MAAPQKIICHAGPLASPAYNRVIEPRPDVRLQPVDPDAPAATIQAVLAAAHIYQVSSTRDETPRAWWGNAELLARAPNLLAVSTNGAGFDTVDLAACTAAGVLAVCQAGGNAEAVAEHVLGMMLILSKRVCETDHYMRRQSGIRRNDFKGHDVHGRTIGIVGFGHVGRRIAQLCRGLLAMRVLVYDPYIDDTAIGAAGAERAPLPDLLAGADFVSINCPLTEETRGMIGAAQFALMQPHAYFITTARGFIHDEAALVAALRTRQIAGAGVDVWEHEPPPSDHPMMAFDNVLVSPHTAGVTQEARDTVARIAAEQVLTILDGGRPERLLNPEVWPLYLERRARILAA